MVRLYVPARVPVVVAVEPQPATNNAGNMSRSAVAARPASAEPRRFVTRNLVPKTNNENDKNAPNKITEIGIRGSLFGLPKTDEVAVVVTVTCTAAKVALVTVTDVGATEQVDPGGAPAQVIATLMESEEDAPPVPVT
jgi:hypothetical protein